MPPVTNPAVVLDYSANTNQTHAAETAVYMLVPIRLALSLRVNLKKRSLIIYIAQKCEKCDVILPSKRAPWHQVLTTNRCDGLQPKGMAL